MLKTISSFILNRIWINVIKRIFCLAFVYWQPFLLPINRRQNLATNMAAKNKCLRKDVFYYAYLFCLIRNYKLLSKAKLSFFGQVLSILLEIHACSKTLALLTKNATIFWEHEVFLECCHSNTTIYIFLYFFQKIMKIMEKILVLILVLLTNFLYCHPYVITMPNVSLNLI